MAFDYTLQMYHVFCDVLKHLPCPIVTFNEYLETNRQNRFVVVLRHDVDRFISSAVRMAEVEADYDIRATYYIRMTRQVFQPAEIRKIHSLGHDIGYHYETLTKAKGDFNRAAQIFRDELRQLREIAPVHTISMHGSPLTPWNNMDIWRKYDFRNYQIRGDVALSTDSHRLFYFTDTGRNWDAGKYNIRDHVESLIPAKKVGKTDDLIAFLQQHDGTPVIINIHPNRWAATIAGNIVSALTDWSINRLKWTLSVLMGIFNQK
jgi:hypothetical protein